MMTICIGLLVAFFTLAGITLNQHEPINKTTLQNYSVGANTMVLMECLNSNINIDQVTVAAVKSERDGSSIGSNNTIIYNVQETKIMSNMTYLPNKTIFYTDNLTDNSVPVGVSYFESSGPLYTADEGGTMNYTVMLINTNMTRLSCALRLIVFDSSGEYIDYTKGSSKDPDKDLPPNLYCKERCVGDNGTHNFNFTLRPNTFFFFVASHVAGVNFSVNASGNISRYLISDQGSRCTVTFSSPPCTFQINQKSNGNDAKRCLFGQSTNPFTGCVMANTTNHTYKKVYKTKYKAATAIVGFIFIIAGFIYIILLIIIYRSLPEN